MRLRRAYPRSRVKAASTPNPPRSARMPLACSITTRLSRADRNCWASTPECPQRPLAYDSGGGDVGQTLGEPQRVVAGPGLGHGPGRGTGHGRSAMEGDGADHRARHPQRHGVRTGVSGAERQRREPRPPVHSRAQVGGADRGGRAVAVNARTVRPGQRGGLDLGDHVVGGGGDAQRPVVVGEQDPGRTDVQQRRGPADQRPEMVVGAQVVGALVVRRPRERHERRYEFPLGHCPIAHRLDLIVLPVATGSAVLPGRKAGRPDVTFRNKKVTICPTIR